MDFYEFLGITLSHCTMRDISEPAGISPSTVYRIVKRDVSPCLDTCEKILKPLGKRLIVSERDIDIE